MASQYIFKHGVSTYFCIVCGKVADGVMFGHVHRGYEIMTASFCREHSRRHVQDVIGCDGDCQLPTRDTCYGKWIREMGRKGTSDIPRENRLFFTDLFRHTSKKDF